MSFHLAGPEKPIDVKRARWFFNVRWVRGLILYGAIKRGPTWEEVFSRSQGMPLKLTRLHWGLIVVVAGVGLSVFRYQERRPEEVINV